MKAINLRTEYLVNPIGIGARRPRLMWVCGGTGKKQTAYQIVTEKWDSGKVASASMHADYLPLLVKRLKVGAQSHLAHVRKFLFELSKRYVALFIDELHEMLAALRHGH